MLELLYQSIADEGPKAESVADFVEKFITSEDSEYKFYDAIRDAKFVGFKAGFAAAMSIFAEVAR